MISIIVAIARNYAIGRNNDLLWHLPDDLRRFKRITAGHCVIMGKKTWESLPVRPLPGRRNIILTDNPGDCFDCSHTSFSIEDALKQCSDCSEVFVIGGGSVYRQFMDIADRLLITWVDKDYEGDTFFPEIDPDIWEVSDNEGDYFDDANGFTYRYVTYLRKER
ncbi:MAG: dihydrofolate reductase [Bacteroidales bacterium]|nr:dihydrofolate reductase [Bacteroidales bacterium]